MPNVEAVFALFEKCKSTLCPIFFVLIISSSMYITDTKFTAINDQYNSMKHQDEIRDNKIDKIVEKVDSIALNQALSAHNAQRLDKLEEARDIDDKRLDKHETQISILEHRKK